MNCSLESLRNRNLNNHGVLPAMLTIASGLLFLPSLALAQVQTVSACQKLATMTLSQTTVTLAEEVEPGAFSLPGASAPDARIRDTYKQLPGFCRMAATIRPTSDSEIKIEVWLPSAGWNGKLQVVGNGGWAGSISYPAMARALAAGYATASTNTGHDGDRASFAPGHPEKLVDFAWRAVHLTVLQSKATVTSYYGSPAKRAYWNGCSSGGKQGLKEAQMFPNDFDGLVTGAPANNWNHQKSAFAAKYQATHRAPERAIPKEKYKMIHNAVLNACDSLDGVKDGVLENPIACHFNPEILKCEGADGPACLTGPQVATMQILYAPTKDPRNGTLLFPGMEPGTELALGTLIGDEPRLTQTDLFAYVVLNKPDWNVMTFDIAKDLPLAEKIDATVGTAATDPNLKPLFAHHAKLLMYHGFSDPNIMPENTINYYKSAVDASGGLAKTKDSIRLFMVPGMGHCSGGEGPNAFDMVTALDAWVEEAKTPDRIIAAKLKDGEVVRTRPLCPYPQVAKYVGTGSTDEAANFVCRAQ